MRVLALIPARSGSKGIKDKNICDFRGLPLIAHSIKAALESGVCEEVFVCTDSPKYASIAKEFGASVPFLRSEESARDESKSIDCVLESLQNYKKLRKEFDVLLLLQPTSPLREAWHIREAYELFLSCAHQSLASVCEVKEHPLFMRRLNDHTLIPLLDSPSSVRRQDLESFYRLNGAIYLNLISELHAKSSFNDNKIAYVMAQKYSLDIDCLEDLKAGDS